MTKPAKAWMEVHQDTRALLQSAAACTSLTLACICVQISSQFRMCSLRRVCSLHIECVLCGEMRADKALEASLLSSLALNLECVPYIEYVLST